MRPSYSNNHTYSLYHVLLSLLHSKSRNASPNAVCMLVRKCWMAECSCEVDDR